MSDTTAIIQFVGMVLLSTHASPDHELQAIMPLISPTAVHAPQDTRLRPTGRFLGDTTPGSITPILTPVEEPIDFLNPHDHVEEHIAIIAFPACDYISSRGWTLQGLARVPGYLYVRLDGEHIRFTSDTEPDGKSPLATTKARRVTDSAGLPRQALGLPSLQKCCNSPMMLKAGFRHPDYAGASAVFDIPRSGKVHACALDPKSRKSRIDTIFAFENGGVVIITADEGKKEMRFRGNVHFYAAHLPTVDVTGQPGISGKRHHYTAYYDMLEGTDENRKSCSSDFHCGESSASDAPKLAACQATVFQRPGPSSAVPRPPISIDIALFARTDFECSNSQYP